MKMNKTKTPQLRLKGFQGEWEESSWGDLTNDFKYGINAAAMEYDGHNKYLRITDIEDSTRKFSQENLTTPNTNLDCCNEYLMCEGDIVIARTGASTGKSYIYHNQDGKVYFAGFLIRMRMPEKVDKEYIFQNTLTNGYAKHIRLVSQRSGQPGVNVDELKSYKFFIPQNKAEQQSIGKYLSNLDSLIASSTSHLASLKQIKAASLLSMFPKEGETTPQVRFKGFTGDWVKILVDKLGRTYSGLAGKGKDDFGIGNARFITFLNVLTNAHIDTSILEAVNVKDGEHQNLVKKGDLFFNTSSETPEEVGMCAVLDEELENVYLNSFCFGFRITDKNVAPAFFAYLMRSCIGRRIMSILAQGATRYNLSKNNFCNTEILMPTEIKEQEMIADYFTSLDKQISLQVKRLEKLKQIKSACLDLMFV